MVRSWIFFNQIVNYFSFFPSAIYRIMSPPPTKSCADTLTRNVIVSGDGASGRQRGLDDAIAVWPPCWDQCPMRRHTRELAFTLWTMWARGEKMSSCLWSRREFSLSSQTSSLQNWEITSVVSAAQYMLFCYGNLSWLRHHLLGKI